MDNEMHDSEFWLIGRNAIREPLLLDHVSNVDGVRQNVLVVYATEQDALAEIPKKSDAASGKYFAFKVTDLEFLDLLRRDAAHFDVRYYSVNGTVFEAWPLMEKLSAKGEVSEAIKCD